MEEGEELVMDKDQEAVKDMTVETTAGGASVELWLNTQAKPVDRLTEAEPGCVEKVAARRS